MRAIFLDRDGVINENRHDHVKSWDEFKFIPGSLTAIRWLHLAGFKVFVVTNQAIVNRGIVSAQDIEEIHRRMVQQVSHNGGIIHDIRYSPHDNHEQSIYRKPGPGMLLDLAAAWQINLSRSYMVGDAMTDMQAGRSAGCSRVVMVRTGRGAEQLQLPACRLYPPDYVANDLLAAVAWMCSHEQVVTASDRTLVPRLAAGNLSFGVSVSAGQ